MYQDEAGFGRISKLGSCWSPIGVGPHVHSHYIREFRYYYGAVDAYTGESFFLRAGGCNTEWMNVFLEELSQAYPDDYFLLVMDNAIWHKSSTLKIPTNIGFAFIPPYTDYVIYNIPQLAGVALTPSLYTEMLKNPRVIGVKNSSMPVQDIQTFVSLGGEDHIVFNGPDEQFLGGRLMGARAGIGGTYGAMPELFLKLNQLIADKDLETARELQYAINAIIGKLTSAHGNMYGVIKEVLKINEGLNIGSVRSPLTPVTEEDRPVVEAAAALIRETKERFL
ncbi:N-acetylneuraminate lyase [Streptococcus pneumoniae]|nr:N-acetylneuraminate lyase [Streptococcus pneumoniae]